MNANAPGSDRIQVSLNQTKAAGGTVNNCTRIQTSANVLSVKTTQDLITTLLDFQLLSKQLRNNNSNSVTDTHKNYFNCKDYLAKTTAVLLPERCQ